MEFNVVHVTQYIRHLIKTEFYNLQKNIKSITTLLYWAWSQFKLKIFNFFFLVHFLILMVNHQSTWKKIVHSHCYVNKVRFQAIFLLIYLELNRKWRVKNKLNATKTSNHLCVFLTNIQLKPKQKSTWNGSFDI